MKSKASSSRPLRLGPVALGSVPRLVAILDRSHPIDDVLALGKRGASILELRIDSFDSPQQGLACLRSLSENREIRRRFGLLATYRENDSNRGKRLSVFQSAAALSDALDIEYECKERQELVCLAHAHSCLAILSTHDFASTPASDGLEAVMDEAGRLGADITKIAVYAQSLTDLQRLLAFTETHKEHGLITIAMGEHGLFSRIAAPFLGSLLSYGYVSKANAPGQLSLDELHDALFRFHPDYKRDFEA